MAEDGSVFLPSAPLLGHVLHGTAKTALYETWKGRYNKEIKKKYRAAPFGGRRANVTEETNMDLKERALKAHEQWGGKIEVVARCEVNSKDDLSIAYTPGAAEPCL